MRRCMIQDSFPNPRRDNNASILGLKRKSCAGLGINRGGC